LPKHNLLKNSKELNILFADRNRWHEVPLIDLSPKNWPPEKPWKYYWKLDIFIKIMAWWICKDITSTGSRPGLRGL
jgi:hypothetical protein